MKDSIELPTSKDLLDQIIFDVENGKIWLNEQRMILTHSSFFWILRRELIKMIGMPRTKALFKRLGYHSGHRDAQVAKKLRPEISTSKAFMAGPQLALIKGMVNVSPLHLEFDLKSGDFYGEFKWEDAFEAELQLSNEGYSPDSVCWILTGYASGFTSFYMGKNIIYVEQDCKAKGDQCCSIIGKPLDQWDNQDELGSEYQDDNIIDELSSIRNQLANIKVNTASSSSASLFPDAIGEAPEYKKACKLIQYASKGEVTVLLQGETGVGKEIFANNLHKSSNRSDGPFVAINCACIPPELIESELFGAEKGAFTGSIKDCIGKFERANNGTIFLDEIAELSPRAQSALLRVLQEREIERVGGRHPIKIDVRVIAATHVDLYEAVKKGNFRQDLFYRLNVYPISIPALRNRKTDITLLTNYFIEKFNEIYKKKIKGITEQASKKLINHSWPGNIRELENMIERSVILTDNNSNISIDSLQFPMEPSVTNIINDKGNLSINDCILYSDPLCKELLNSNFRFDEFETKLYRTAMNEAHGNVTEAAKLLGLSRAQLAYRMDKLGI